MKKTLLLMLASCLLFSATACQSAVNNTTTPSGETEETTMSDTASPSQSESSVDSTKETPLEPTTENTSEPATEQPSENEKTNILVAYFSATNTTKTLAEYVADSLGAEVYEIIPTQPYTSADLNYRDDNSRSSKEMNDPSCRPEISGSVEDMSQYDIVFIAYPIWWGEAPRIVSTFMESYDFSGKTVIPFCTSGGSGIGSSGSNLEKLTSGATWLAGRRFGGGTSRDTMTEWVNGLGIGITAE